MKLSCVSGRALNYRTVLWIGDREANEVRGAYETAELCSSQLAYRPSLASAIDRPASDVDLMIVAASDRTPLSDASLTELNRRHPSAMRLLLQSPLCTGVHIAGDEFFGAQRHNWIEGTDVLRRMLSREDSPIQNSNCVAVIASNFSAAETLLQVAEDSGCSAFWCRSEGTLAIRGVDTVWWDDSYAVPTDTVGWTKRIEAMNACATSGTASQKIAHTWITNRVHWLQVHQAREAGVGLVLTKPFPLELLSDSLGSGQVSGRFGTTQHPALDRPQNLRDAA
ncbi:hypothetical protein LF1_10190 [Rubripirellula obstinata]|uniref:Uncharacterized protein n=1 Tax=Rubripirellula obstinata TaxID=406547 RepID=A0A5B1CFK2_9BACT|nr:hypothetical protein [Rubripirellula obstinata]KAA1258499.1 hypothetical protein LF1_10190 [Rubripirellula obstinata]